MKLYALLAILATLTITQPVKASELHPQVPECTRQALFVRGLQFIKIDWAKLADNFNEIVHLGSIKPPGFEERLIEVKAHALETTVNFTNSLALLGVEIDITNLMLEYVNELERYARDYRNLSFPQRRDLILALYEEVVDVMAVELSQIGPEIRISYLTELLSGLTDNLLTGVRLYYEGDFHNARLFAVQNYGWAIQIADVLAEPLFF